MKKSGRLSWESSIKKLKYHDVVNPLLVISDFFAVDWIYGHIKKLKSGDML